MANLDTYLLRLEGQVTARGGVVHWARDAAEANRIVTDLVRATGADEVVKVKSMATQEIGLNEHLEAHGIAAYETDLAELIVQLGHDKPSHILVPAIHRNRPEIREIFLAEMDGVDPNLTDEPAVLGAPPPASICGGSSSPPGSRSPAPTSPSRTPAPSVWSSPRATAGCV
jgi:L-lactate dehydrogenase complex protein LldF